MDGTAVPVAIVVITIIWVAKCAVVARRDDYIVAITIIVTIISFDCSSDVPVVLADVMSVIIPVVVGQCRCRAAKQQGRDH